MACRGSTVRWLFAALTIIGAMLSSGCQYRWVYVDDDEAISPESYGSIQIGHSTRQDVLDRLGPPDDVRYTLDREVLDYRFAHHSGSDLTFFVPFASLFSDFDPISFMRGIANDVAPSFDEPQATRPDRFIRFIFNLFGLVLSAAPTNGDGSNVLDLHGRQLQYDKVHIALDRASLVVREKGVELTHDPRGFIQRSLLTGDGPKSGTQGENQK